MVLTYNLKSLLQADQLPLLLLYVFPEIPGECGQVQRCLYVCVGSLSLSDDAVPHTGGHDAMYS